MKRPVELIFHHLGAQVSCTLLFLFVQSAWAQWSTSTDVFSTLYVCPGFATTILSFDDGSSVICGGLSDSRYAQKLDAFGYKVWPQPVQIVNNPGTNTTTMYGPIDDGDGGIILWWPDERGAEYGEFGPFNNALYMQRVDKYGAVRWQDGGVQIDSVAGGLKDAAAISDGLGGIILYVVESDFLRTRASHRAHTWIVRYDAYGQMAWSLNVDSSSVEYTLVARQPFRFGNKVMISTLEGSRFLDPVTGANLPPPAYVPKGWLVGDGDMAAFAVERLTDRYDSLGRLNRQYAVTRLTSDWDSLWSSNFEILDRGDLYNTVTMHNNILPDKVGGLFYCEPSSNDSTRPGVRLRRITSGGSQFNHDEVQIFDDSLSSMWGFNGKGEFGICLSSGKAFKFDTTGKSIWPQEFSVFSNPSEAYSPVVASDNNGGAIIAYWTTLGGIYAQHTGRVGKVGVITSVNNGKAIPSELAIDQNYPNPFNPTTTVRIVVNKAQPVVLRIYDVLGREVATLLKGNLTQGNYEVKWDGSGFASGIYFYTLVAGQRSTTRKMVLLR